MCGVFGLNGLWRRDDVAALAALASRRGPHGWGIAIGAHRWEARAEPFRELPPLLHGGGPVIGNCRLATSASYQRIDALQPLAFDGFAVSHNGTVPDAAEWQKELRCEWSTGNDSEMIGHWLERNAGLPWNERLMALAPRLVRPFALAVSTDEHVWLMRRGQPLYVTDRAACSRPFDGATMLPEMEVKVLTRQAETREPIATVTSSRGISFAGGLKRRRK